MHIQKINKRSMRMSSYVVGNITVRRRALNYISQRKTSFSSYYSSFSSSLVHRIHGLPKVIPFALRFKSLDRKRLTPFHVKVLNC